MLVQKDGLSQRKLIVHYLFTIFDVNLGISNKHVSQISNLLSLETVEIGLRIGRDVDKFLAGDLQRLLQL